MRGEIRMSEALHVMIVDDNEDDRFLYERLLSKVDDNSYAFSHAESCEEAVSLNKINKAGCILLDYSFPETSGLEWLSEIINDDGFKNVPVIMLTGNGDERIAVKAIRNGVSDYLVKSEITSDILVKAISNAVERNQLKSELEAKGDQLERLALTDFLTGISNRYSFDRELKKYISRAKRFDNKLALLFLDIDNFKTINDAYGHDVGDLVLKKYTEIFQSCIRSNDVLARLSGDEFGIILEGIRSQVDAENMSKKILSKLELPIKIREKLEIKLSVSIGISLLDGSDQSSDQLLKNADIAMYEAKKNGKNTFQMFDSNFDKQENAFIRIERELYAALTHDELHMVYQPIYEGKSLKIVGAEALLRWASKSLGIMSPNDFIPIAEKSQLIILVGEFVLKQALINFRECLALDPNFTMSINLSPLQLVNDNFYQLLAGLIAKHDLPAEQIIVEVTETAMMSSDTIMDRLYQLKSLNIKIALDDFGTGYSSLLHLVNWPVDILKVDKSFTFNCPEQINCVKIVNSIFSIANIFGLETVVEGVETESNYEFLSGQNSLKLQGYFFSKPMKIDKFVKLIDSNKIA
ncbi:MAG: hypothetical protein COC19_06565 [SAR86 cluster bacterium]|uniref:GGDEF domain-containing response regulator n=1 Tax=SAR86 cluster bacterium TaxID=2030880 RepID=A0A2A4MIN2_9GAMM|nr:MAG: hypothetical protein COC19_06565 [SAR86 cluster bacterium]